MSWRDHLQKSEDTAVLPWTGGRKLLGREAEHFVEARLPPEHGWHVFRILVRKALFVTESEPRPDDLRWPVVGYLVGDRMVPDGARCDPDPRRIVEFSETVHLIEPGLDRFARVSAGRIRSDGPLVYRGPEMPCGPEDDVLRAYQDRAASVDAVPGVTPALDAAFRMESWQRAEAERRRAELERLRLEQEARLAEEARVREVAERLGDARGRRQMAAIDFRQGAAAALAIGGAEYLDHRRGHQAHEMVVTFRLDARRFQCVCDARTLGIIEAGICLTDHRTGFRGDGLFTLESLPGVIREAQQRRVLHVFRHVDGGHVDGGWDGGEEDDDD